MADAAAFSPDYATARQRFREAAAAAGAELTSVPFGAEGPGVDLTLDVAHLGAKQPARALVVSSGLHGVEGYFGSAVQLAALGGLFKAPLPEGTAVLLLHALNPFGFAWGRRVNEDNVDLNRNFLQRGEAYAGSPDGYAALDAFLNPPSAPGALDGALFLPRALLKILRHGMPALKNAVAGGQYDFPKGVFFGGSGPSETQDQLRTLLPDRLGSASRVLHVDFHTGLGKRGTYKVFVDHPWGSEGLRALAEEIGSDVVEPWEPKDGVSYEIRGGLGTWCKALLPDVEYDVLAAEFGTVHVLKVIRALHLENRAWQHLDRADPAAVALRQRLVDTFAPPEDDWRNVVVERGLGVLGKALGALDTN